MASSNQTLNNRLAEATADVDLELWKLLDHAHSGVSRARELELGQYGLTLEQAGLLRTLMEKGGSATNSEIADSYMRQYNSVTTLVNRMEKSGLVKKEKSPADKRFIVSITDKGLNLYNKVTLNSIRMAFLELSSSEKQELAKYLAQVTVKARQMLMMDQKLPFLT
jgi:DNA-binding MarR family transcriptional regulator